MHSDGPNKLASQAAALGLHTVVVYLSAIHLSPWLVFHWFGWVAPILHISIDVPANDWYLRHFELVAMVPALIIGHINVIRFLPDIVGSYIGELRSNSVAARAWIIPALILGYKMLLYHAPSSVLFASSMSAIKYFFDIQQVVPTMTNPLAGDPIRALAQLTVTAPFYAGVAYSLGAFASERKLMAKLFR